MAKIGRRQKRINKFIAQFETYSSDPAEQIDFNKIAPILTPAYGYQLKRGYRQKRNTPCYCESGKKFKDCHMAHERATPRLNEDNEIVIYNSHNKKWMTPVDVEMYIKDLERSE